MCFAFVSATDMQCNVQIVQLLLMIQLKQVTVKKATQQNNYIIVAFLTGKIKVTVQKATGAFLSIANLPVYQTLTRAVSQFLRSFVFHTSQLKLPHLHCRRVFE